MTLTHALYATAISITQAQASSFAQMLQIGEVHGVKSQWTISVATRNGIARGPTSIVIYMAFAALLVNFQVHASELP